jgi:nitroreductase
LPTRTLDLNDNPLSAPPSLGGWEAALRARYREQSGARPSAGWNEVLETILDHRSVRRFRADPLPAGALETIVAAAQSASSSSNLQAWSVVAVEDPERRARLAALVGGQRHVAEAPLVLVFLADLARLDGAARRRGAPAEGLNYLDSFLVGVVDAALAAQNAVVALESLGLGSCYIGAVRNRPEEVAAELGLPPKVFAVFGLTIGVPDPAAATAVKPRLPPAVVLHRERYQAAESTELSLYDSRLRSFQREQRMREQDWTVQATERVKGPEALSGRHRLRDALAALGFHLR